MSDASPAMRLLFVDDEKLVLQSLRRSLGENPNWQPAFVKNASQALERLAQEPYDVVVAEYMMPEVDGLALLEQVKAQWPGTVRILLAGSGPMPARRADVVAHQILNKPWQPEDLRASLGRIVKVRALLSETRFRSAAGDADSLPSVPQILLELNATMADRWASAEDIAAVIGKDAAMSAKILQLVNSAFFGLTTAKTASIGQAVVQLGITTVGAIATSLAIFRAFDRSVELPGFDIAALQWRASLVAQLARTMFRDQERRDEAFAGALLMGVGQLVLATELRFYFRDVLKRHLERQVPVHKVELEMSAVSHAAVGAYLLGIWGLPAGVVDAVAGQFDLRPAADRGFDPIDAVHIASQLIDTAVAKQTNGDSATDSLDAAWLVALGIERELKRWRQLADRLVAGTA